MSPFDQLFGTPEQQAESARAADLLAVLEHVLNRATMPGFLRDKVKAAIAKATV